MVAVTVPVASAITDTVSSSTLPTVDHADHWVRGCGNRQSSIARPAPTANTRMATTLRLMRDSNFRLLPLGTPAPNVRVDLAERISQGVEARHLNACVPGNLAASATSLHERLDTRPHCGEVLTWAWC